MVLITPVSISSQEVSYWPILPRWLLCMRSIWGFFLSTQREGAPFPEALQYRVDAWSGRSKPLFQLPVLKIRLICSPPMEDISDIKLIRTDTTLDLSQKAEEVYL